MLNKISTQALSTVLSLSLLFSSSTASAGLGSATPQIPVFVRALTPPAHLGFLDSYHQGQSQRPIVLIQDLHANYGVQKKIIGLLKFLQAKVAPGDQPLRVGIEGAWGDIDLSFLQNEEPAAKEGFGDVMLKNAEITGMEQFAMTSKSPVQLVGIDNPEDYILHRDLFRKSLAARLELAARVDQLHRAVMKSKGDAPRALRKIWKVEAAFKKGEIGLPELAGELGVPSIANYGMAEALLYKRKVEISEKTHEKANYLKNLVKAEQDLSLLARLFRQQLTLEEVQFVAHQIPEILVVIQVLLPGEKMEPWQEAVKTAIDYYAVALMRDKPLGQHALELADRSPDAPVIIVTGGFHTAGICDLLREKKRSYVVVAPVVESHTARDEALYLRRMLEEPINEATLSYVTHSSGQRCPVQFKMRHFYPGIC